MSISSDLKVHQRLIKKMVMEESKKMNSSLQTLRKAAIKAVKNNTFGKPLTTSLRAATSILPDFAMDRLTTIGTKEAQFTTKLMSKYFKSTISAPSPEIIEKAIMSNKMSIGFLVQGTKAPKKSLNVAYTQFAQRKADDLVQIIKDSKSLKRTTEETINIINERVNGLIAAQAKSLSKTAITFVSNVVRAKTIKSDKSTTNTVIWIADDGLHHCSVCDEFDGQTFDLDDIDTPPLHWGCECYLEPTDE